MVLKEEPILLHSGKKDAAKSSSSSMCVISPMLLFIEGGGEIVINILKWFSDGPPFSSLEGVSSNEAFVIGFTFRGWWDVGLVLDIGSALLEVSHETLCLVCVGFSFGIVSLMWKKLAEKCGWKNANWACLIWDYVNKKYLREGRECTYVKNMICPAMGSLDPATVHFATIFIRWKVRALMVEQWSSELNFRWPGDLTEISMHAF